MQYADIYLRNTPDFYTWSFTDKPVNVGSRVQVFFRGRPRIGLVVKVHQSPVFHTIQPIQKVLEPHFILPQEVEKAQWISQKYFCSFQKVLSLMIPESFLFQVTPVPPNIQLTCLQPDAKLRGIKQKALLEHLKNNQNTTPKVVAQTIASNATIKSLITKGILQETHIITKKPTLPADPALLPLTQDQTQALAAAKASQKIKLLWGVTGSGKTEVYKNILLDTIKQGHQALLIVPEIALTHHLLSRLVQTFGDTMAVWHSDMSKGEKTRAFHSIINQHASLIVGTRSSLLLPYPNLSTVIVDEEHTWTLKNQSNPRFSTHEILEHLHQTNKIDVLLGTATPRAESWHKADQGEYTRIDLPNRINNTPMPAISIMDMRQESKKGNYSLFSHALMRNIKTALDNKEQIVLFLNKRGLFGTTFCKSCGHTFECPNCSQNMKLHQKGSKKAYLCHFCGHMESYTGKCPSCKSLDFQFRSSGTQQAEIELQKLFPTARIARADADTITSRYDMPNLLKKLEAGEYDILLGTQMIAKGLDLDRVQLVGILLADTGLSLPDFRSEERVFQLIMQVTGRAGRRKKQGKIIIQTYQTEHAMFPFVAEHDIAGFMAHELKNRQQASFSPFGAMIKCTFTHPEKNTAHALAKQWRIFCQANSKFSVNMAPAFFPRMNNKYSFHVFIMAPKQSTIETWLNTHKSSIPKEARIDISPLSIL